MRRRIDLSLYLVTDPVLCARRGIVETAVAAVRGGATMVQLRDKEASDEAMVEIGRALERALTGTGVPLIVNDRLAVALAVGADGLHIGQNDGDVRAARARMGPDAILGLSVEALAHVRAIDADVVDYVGASPVFATSTKPDHAPPLGVEGLAEICAASPVPVVAIGGVSLKDAPALIGAGAAGLAVVSAICAAEDPEGASRALRKAVEAARS